jgi:nucleoside-diphosphate-sugar epimerase
MRIWLIILLLVCVPCFAKKVLVIGGTGRVGSAVVNRLAALGIETVVMSRRAQTSQKMPKVDGVTYLTGDISDMGDLMEATKGCDAVIDVHGCTPPRFSKITDLFIPPKYDLNHPYNVNYMAMLKLTTVMSINRVPKLIRITGSLVGKSPFQPFVALFNLLLSQTIKWHEMGEGYIRYSGIDYTVIRPPAIVSSLPFPEPRKLVLVPGDGREDIERPGQIAVDDLATLCVLALDETKLSYATVVCNTVPGEGSGPDEPRTKALAIGGADERWRAALSSRKVSELLVPCPYCNIL